MKRFITLTLSILLTLSLFACSTEDTQETTRKKRVGFYETVAVKIGEHDISVTELNYFYIDEINQFVENNQYAQYYIDFSTPLNQQFLNGKDGQTWADNFLHSAINEAKNTYALYDAAVAAGYKLTAEEQKELSEQEESLNTYAQYYGYKDSDEYLKGYYGLDSDTQTFLRYYEVTKLAKSYYSAVSAFKTPEDMEAWNNSLTDKISCTEKETKYVRRDYVINPYGSPGY